MNGTGAPGAHDATKTRQVRRIDRRTKASAGFGSAAQEMAFNARDLLKCGLPFKRWTSPDPYRRRNGDFALEVVGHPKHGIPFGSDRLLIIWLATAFHQAGCPTDRIIRFSSASDLLRAFSEATTFNGAKINNLRAGLFRIYTATWFVGTLEGNVIESERFALIKRMRLWFELGSRTNQHTLTLWPNELELTSDFADALTGDGTVPLDMNVIRSLREEPLALDFYCWQAYRSYTLLLAGRDVARIPIFGERGLVAQMGTQTRDRYRLRQMLRQAQARIVAHWPKCPNRFDGSTSLFYVRPATAMHTERVQLALPGIKPKGAPVPPVMAPADVDVERHDV